MELENVVPLDPLPGSHHHLDTWNGQGIQLQLTKWKNSFELDQPQRKYLHTRPKCNDFHLGKCCSCGELTSLQGVSSFSFYPSFHKGWLGYFFSFMKYF
jgi:hypothetical protein